MAQLLAIQGGRRRPRPLWKLENCIYRNLMETADGRQPLELAVQNILAGYAGLKEELEELSPADRAFFANTLSRASSAALS